MKLRPVVFHAVQSRPRLRLGVSLGLRKAWAAKSNCLPLCVPGLREPRCVRELGKEPGRREKADPSASLQPSASNRGRRGEPGFGAHSLPDQDEGEGVRRGEARSSCSFAVSLFFYSSDFPFPGPSFHH